MFPSVLREWLIMRRSLRYGTLIFREFRRTNEGIQSGREISRIRSPRLEMDYVGDQLIMLGMLWLNFLLFHESSAVFKKISVNGRVGVRTVEGGCKGYRDEGKTKVQHLRQKCMRGGVFVKYFFFSGITRNALFFC